MVFVFSDLISITISINERNIPAVPEVVRLAYDFEVALSLQMLIQKETTLEAILMRSIRKNIYYKTIRVIVGRRLYQVYLNATLFHRAITGCSELVMRILNLLKVTKMCQRYFSERKATPGKKYLSLPSSSSNTSNSLLKYTLYCMLWWQAMILNSIYS